MDIPYEMRVTYYKRRLEDYSACLKAIENQKTDFLQTVGHQMKGNAQPFGFDELAVIGNELEIAAKANDWQKIKILVEKFGIYLSQNAIQ